MSDCKHAGLAALLACPRCNVGLAQQQQGSQLGALRAGRIHLAECGLDTNHKGGCGPAPPVMPAELSGDISAPTRREARIAFLERKREATKADLLMKYEDADWHGVQDCGSDLRDIESELKGLRFHG